MIPDASLLTKRGLRVLRGHKIKHLEVIGLTKATINELIGCLGEYTLNNISFLSVSRSYFTSSARFCVVVGLAKLRNLKHLDVSHTDINHHGLEIIVEDLPNLLSLNISATRVKDLNPLKKCKNRLKCLSMYNLRCSSSALLSLQSHNNNNQQVIDPFMTVILELNQLVKLDISDDRDSPVDVVTRGSTSVLPLLKRPDLFTHLKYLDISGKDGIELEELKKFIAYKCALGHDYSLSFLGLMQTDICTNDAFTHESEPTLIDSSNEDAMEVDGEEETWKEPLADQKPNITVTGFATQSQILNSLKVYADRPTYIQKSLCYLYNYTINELASPRVDLIDIILPVMKKHSKMIGIQMAATACLYNLTKGKIADKIHPKWLSKVVNATLDAMESFPNHQQLQKNTLLTLCSDRILQEVVSFLPSFLRTLCRHLFFF
jgi:Zyg-11 family protein